MEKVKSTLKALCTQMTIAGYEYLAEGTIKELCGDIFDEIRVDPMGSFTLVKKSKLENAPKYGSFSVEKLCVSFLK